MVLKCKNCQVELVVIEEKKRPLGTSAIVVKDKTLECPTCKIQIEDNYC